MSAAAALALEPKPNRHAAAGSPATSGPRPTAAPRRTREVLRIIREPFRLRLLPTTGWDRWEFRPCGTRRRAPVGSELDRLGRRGCDLARPATHHRHRLSGQHELADIRLISDPSRRAAHDIRRRHSGSRVGRNCGTVRHKPPKPSQGAVTWAPARVAMERPFSVPPRPSGTPNSRILTPLTGNGKRPRAEAKATAGVSRPGSFRAARSIRLSLASAARSADRAARLALSRPCSTLPIKSLRLSTWRASASDLLPLGLERLFGLGLLFLPLLRSAG